MIYVGAAARSQARRSIARLVSLQVGFWLFGGSSPSGLDRLTFAVGLFRIRSTLTHWVYAMTTQSRSLRLADTLSRAPYAWPGGYPLFAITNDGAALCHYCCTTERLSIATTTGTDGWNVISHAVNWEDPDLFCDNCSARIESAYAEA